MTPNPDNRNRQTLRVRRRNRRQLLCGIRGGNWQKPKPDSTATRETAARAHAADERGVSPKQAECGTLPNAAQRPRRGADLPRRRAKEKAVTAKTAPRDIRGVTQSQRWTRTAANETVRNITNQAQMQTRTRQVQIAIQKAASSTRKTVAAVRSAIRNFLADLHSLTAILAAGAGAALGIVIVICLVAFVSGSAYGIFFAADAPQRSVRHRARSRRNPDRGIPRQAGRNLRHRTARPPRHYCQR